ncbi:hypothetical protein I7I48_10974 [Histoplasma ohiense]|nr:hypothetical protein I7I48_10974 [Histoplasma ohiense (nom. inval.)]
MIPSTSETPHRCFQRSVSCFRFRWHHCQPRPGPHAEPGARVVPRSKQCGRATKPRDHQPASIPQPSGESRNSEIELTKVQGSGCQQ